MNFGVKLHWRLMRGGPEVDPEEPGFKELEYKESKWYYKDSYTGFFQSWGREVVWYDKKPFWAQIYGGGMEPEFRDDKEFAHQTFYFLKKSLSAGEKRNVFQPRGSQIHKDRNWSYSCNWKGDIRKFSGSEKIHYKNKLVFTHDFLGGLIISKSVLP